MAKAKRTSSRRAAATEPLVELLQRAVQSGGADDRYHWFKALAESCPLWSRQQREYDARWGRQTTKYLAYTPPWRAMSACLEQEQPTGEASTAVGRERLNLEFIKSLGSASGMEDSAALMSCSHRQERANIIELRPDDIRVEKGVRLGEPLRSVRRGVNPGTGSLPPIFPGAVKALAIEAKKWLGAMHHASGQLAGRVVRQQWSLSLPFLHWKEVACLLALGRDDWTSDRVVSCHLLVHRFSTPLLHNLHGPGWVARHGYNAVFAERNSPVFPARWDAYTHPIRNMPEYQPGDRL